jgi:hypothetical protein
MFASIPEPPYYAVIFTSRRTAADSGYPETAARMADLARTMRRPVASRSGTSTTNCASLKWSGRTPGLRDAETAAPGTQLGG